MSLDRPQEQPPQGTESGRDSLLGDFLKDFHNGATQALLGSPAKQFASRNPEPSVEKDPKSGDVTALLFTDNIYKQNARQAADKHFDQLVAA